MENKEMNEKIDEQMSEKVKTRAQELDDETLKFKAEVDKINSLEELEKMEQDVIKEIDENDKKLSETEYDLPETTTFRGQVFTREKVCQMVFDLLGCQQVGWQMTLGLFDVMDYWKGMTKKKEPKIKYQYYDATLRLLGQQQYKGYENLRSILVINSLFTDARDTYLEDLSYTYFLANKHDAILQRMDAIHALNDKDI